MTMIKAQKKAPTPIPLSKVFALTSGKSLVTVISVDEDTALLGVRKMVKNHDNARIYINRRLITRLNNSGYKCEPQESDMGAVRDDAVEGNYTVFSIILYPMRKLTLDIIDDPAGSKLTMNDLQEADLHMTAVNDIEGRIVYHINKCRGA